MVSGTLKGLILGTLLGLTVFLADEFSYPNEDRNILSYLVPIAVIGVGIGFCYRRRQDNNYKRNQDN